MAYSLSPVCKWTCGPEDAPYEVRIDRYSGARTGIKASLVSGDVTVNYKTVDAVASFQRCVWQCNDLPRAAPLETRFFRNLRTKSAILIGVSFSDQTLHVKYFQDFDDIKLKDHALVFDTERQDEDGNTTVTYQRVQKENPELYDAQAETGMIRFTPPIEERVVHIWGGVGQEGIADLRLIHTINRRAAEAPQETLMLELFNRATWLRIPNLRLNNQNSALTDQKNPIEERINFFKSHDVVILGGQTGTAYTNVTLSSIKGVPTDFRSFMQGKNLQAVKIEEIAAHIREQLLVVKDDKGKVVGEATCRTMLQVRREPDYNFGNDHGKHDAIHIRLSQSNWRDIATPLDMFVALVSGIFNRDAPKIHQIIDRDEQRMQHLLQETPGLVPPFTVDQKKAIVKEFDRAVAAGANVDYYIAENRKIARFCVDSYVLTFRSAAVSVGRAISFRWLWENSEAPAQNPSDQRQRSASEMMNEASMRAFSRPGLLEMESEGLRSWAKDIARAE